MADVYMDYNATTPVNNEVLLAISSSLHDAWGNPSSTHVAGKRAKQLIEDSRSKVALMIGAKPHEIIFTSGGTESNNMVIFTSVKYFSSGLKGVGSRNCSQQKNTKPHVISSNIEHDSIKLPLEMLASENKIDVTFVPVSKVTGQVVVEDIVNAIRPNTCLISVMMANNETGIIQPISDIGIRLQQINVSRCKMQPPLPYILYHSDAAQTIGKVDVDVSTLAVDYLTIVGHKFYGPRIGALYFKYQECFPTPLWPILYGGGQEKSYRPGTENTAMIAGLGKAAELVIHNLEDYERHMTCIRDYFENSLKVTFGNKIVFNNDRPCTERLPNTINVAFIHENLTGSTLLLEASNVSASTGAACHQDIKASPILMASGVSESLASKSIRLSVGRETSKEDVDIAILHLKDAFNKLCES